MTLAALLSALAGCGSPIGTVTGKVSHKGKLVNGGTLTLVSEEGFWVETRIRPDGTYSVSLPPGAAKIGVRLAQGGIPPIVAPRLPMDLQTRDPEDETLGAYRDPATSPLVCQVGRGTQTFDIDLP